MGKRRGRIPGRATRRDLPGARSPALQPAPALIGARGRPPASSPAPPSQSGPPELGLSRGAGGRCCGLEAEPPSPPSSHRARPSRESKAQAARLATLRRRASRPARFRAAGPGPGGSAPLRAGTRPDGARSRAPTPPPRSPLSRARPCRKPPVCACPGEWVGPARGSPAEAECSRPSPIRCHPRPPWSRRTRTRWTSAPKCSSTVCCGSGPSGGRRPSGPGGECASCVPLEPPGEGARGLRTLYHSRYYRRPLTSLVTLASPYFTPDLAVPGRCGSQLGPGPSLSECWPTWGGTTGPGTAGIPLWNASKSGWGGRAWAKEVMAVVNAHLGQVRSDSAWEGKISSQRYPPGIPTDNSIISTSPPSPQLDPVLAPPWASERLSREREEG